MHRLRLISAGVALLVTGCGGASSGPTTPSLLQRPTPDLRAFLKLPVATPSACPSQANGTTVGRQSPWVGTVDVSVFLHAGATTHQILKTGNDLRSDPLVQTVYFESAKQAYQEFQRLYTCSAGVARSQTPPSYRLELVPTATLAARDLLVRRLARQPAVDTVSCDPTVPCVNVLPSRSPSG
jgi:hypothetical protein